MVIITPRPPSIMAPHSSYSKQINQRMFRHLATNVTVFLIILVLSLGDGAHASIASLVNTKQQIPECQNGYQALGDELCVKYHDLKKSWISAREHCRNECSDLLVLRNENINEMFKKMSIATTGWIGLNKLHTGSKYVWLDEQKTVTSAKTQITLPYKERVDIEAGSEVVIQGKVHKDATWIAVNLREDVSENAEFGLHFNIRYPQNKLVLNTRINRGWGREKRVDAPFKRGETFELRIKAENDRYKFFVNNKYVTDYKYRTPLKDLKAIEINGKMTISSLTYHHNTASYKNFDEGVNTDYALSKCVLFNTNHLAHNLKNWKNENCVSRKPFFCAYNKFKDNKKSPVLTPFSSRKLECPDASWTLSEGTCFKAFQDKSSSGNFWKTREACYKEGADLAEISSYGQRDAVKDLMKAGTNYWIGAYDGMVEGQFEFVSGRLMPAKSVFFPWREGEPNTSKGDNKEDCVEMAADGFWKDSNCALKCDFVCGRKAMEIDPCEAGYYPIGDDLCAKYHTEAKSYYNAREESKKQGHDLLVVKDEQTNTMFKEMISTLDIYGWIGLNRIETCPNYQWLDGNKELVTYVDFLATNKTTQQLRIHSLYKCVQYSKDGEGNIGWDTSECSERLPFFSGYSKSEKAKPSKPVTTETTCNELDCPDQSWTLVDQTCLKAFTDDQSKKTFEEARESVASSYGGDLVEIFDDKMNNIVKALLKKPYTPYWIGCGTLVEDDVMEYVSGKPMSEFGQWNKYISSQTGRCVGLLSTSSNSKWHRVPCNAKIGWIGQVKARGVCGSFEMTISPSVTTEAYEKDVTIKCEATNLEASKIVSITVFKTDSVSNAVTLFPGDKIVSKQNDPENIQGKGHIDAKTPSNSYITVTITKPTYKHSGSYQCIITYVSKNGVLMTAVVERTLKVEKCQTGYTLLGEDMCVKYHSKPLTFVMAREECKKEGNDLLVLKNDKTSNLFKEYVKKTKQSGWIGANRINTFPTYVWLDSTSEPATVSSSFGKTPDSALQKCVKISKNGKFDWESADCAEPHTFFSGYTRSDKLKPTTPEQEEREPHILECPDQSWTRVDQTCLKAFTEDDNDNPKTFEEARESVASSYGGDLVEIFNHKMNKIVKDLLVHNQVYFIGCSDIRNEGNFVSVNGKPMPSRGVFNPWDSKDSSNHGDNRDCVQIKHNGKWNDVPCSVKSNNWVGQVQARTVCKNCLIRTTATPKKMSELDEKTVTIKCDASGLKKSTKLISMTIYKTDDVSSGVSLYPGDKIESTNLDTQHIETKGHIDVGSPEVSYLSVTLLSPTAILSGNYRCRVVYQMNKITKQTETTTKLTIETATTSSLIKALKELREAVKQKETKLNILRKDLAKKDVQLNAEISTKVTHLEVFVTNKHKTCCKSLGSQLLSHVKGITVLENSVTTVRCPKSWTGFSGLCYKEFTQRCTYQQALDHCRGLGGTLAQIYNKETNNFLLNGFEWKKNNGHWVGMNDKTREGKFVWADGKEATYFNWRQMQYNTNREDCSNFFPNLKGQWSMHLCDSLDEFLCQASPLTVKKD